MKITFYYPNPAISLTEGCYQMCEHCKGRVLDGMIKVKTNEELFNAAKSYKDSILLSGGNDKSGKVPWKRFVPAIKRIKEETELKVIMHTGILEKNEVRVLEEIGVDQVLLDWVLDDKTLREVYHAPYGSEEIKRMLENLLESRVEPVPHVLYGIENVEMNKREIKALRGLDDLKIVLIFLVQGFSKLTKTKQISKKGVEDFLTFARENFKGEMAIGCMRGNERKFIDPKAVELGFNRMVIPTKEAIDIALKMGYEVEYRKGCCSLP